MAVIVICTDVAWITRPMDVSQLEAKGKVLLLSKFVYVLSVFVQFVGYRCLLSNKLRFLGRFYSVGCVVSSIYVPKTFLPTICQDVYYT